MNNNDRMPIIVGVGQVVDHWDGADLNQAPSPTGLIVESIKRAQADAGVANLKDKIDTLAVIRAFTDSLRTPFDPFGKAKNFPAAVIEAAAINPRKIIYSTAGGEQPQSLVNELSENIARGDIRLAMITGGEAIAALKTALKHSVTLDWSSDADADIEDRGAKTDFISAYEMVNGMGLPPQTYAAMEEALRARLGMSKTEYQGYMAGICAGLAKTAEQNPFAQFPHAMSAEFLAEASKENYPICDPYLKWNIAQDAVNQASTLMLTSVGYAKELGINPDKWIYLHGYATLTEKLVSERPDLSKSKALELALSGAINSAGLVAADIAYRDIYSCFPIVVHLAAEVLGLDPVHDQMTQTGGLPFFGGAGNNYSTHGIATVVERLRQDRDAYGLVLANGGFISKQSAGVYSARVPGTWVDHCSAALQAEVQAQPEYSLLNEDCTGVIEACTVRHDRHGIGHAYLLARNAQGRVMATVPADHRATMQALHRFDNPVGQTVNIIHRDGKNTLSNPHKLGAPMSDDFLARDFKYVLLKRDGNVLEVRLNRPEAYNALFSAAHFELAEIFDEFERDQELWVAIITGAGEKAFCSGNDLKVSAAGGDMSMPTSGFAGLCSRNDREKPVIAAINGVAMGGGLEIVLACDVAIADPIASFALPEVKVGLFAAAGGVQRLTRQIGEKAAMELILTGRKLAADEASGLGLINSISASGDVMGAARALAQTIAGNSPTSIRASKRVLNAVDDLGKWDKALALSQAEIAQLIKSKDAREGMTAFVQKRKPNWVNG
ncbi:enoyl-CoA hydratase-related protein [Porticoccaceae bacterium]|jgi:acetyl-CoA C-acetyltransferase|nr:enoyl-CoA hydratase-related protein [Porticoccaceae bacterium]MDB9951826.1 enoyl-CoA hydratase-related protein [Porticoccaceae bacterium]MDB9998999.1 enoyl-CoA hydratase-related protein [Porticoccaceae bacterium]MDC0003171.1 enoyl-CoA hydratase-related protein [Porticoccaceae bacterium]